MTEDARSNLCALGWDESYRSDLAEMPQRGEPGRVIHAGRLLLVQTEQQKILAEYPTGRTARSDLALKRPVCGDWVIVERCTENRAETPRGIIRAVLNRRNAVVRQAAGTGFAQAVVANIDAAWIVCGLDRDQGLRSLNRYQALTRIAHVEVTIVLNKMDVVKDVEHFLERARSLAKGLDVVAISAQSRQGIEQIEAKLLPSRTTALLGPSGAGKSTLINALTAMQEQRTDAVRADDRRGRHTTSSGRLLNTKTGALLIDTPGLRELGLVASVDGIMNTYADIVQLAQGCRFRDCHHDREPGCQLRIALQEGQLSPERFLAYLELFAETSIPERKPRRK